MKRVDAWLWPLFMMPWHVGWGLAIALIAVGPPVAFSGMVTPRLSHDSWSVLCLLIGAVWGFPTSMMLDLSYQRFQIARDEAATLDFLRRNLDDRSSGGRGE